MKRTPYGRLAVSRARHLPLAAAVLALALGLGVVDARADALGDGKKALKNNNVAEALQHLRQAVQDDPNRFEAHLYLGLALEKRRQWERALSSFDRAAILDARSAEAQRGRGAALAQLGRLEEAVQAYRRATDLDRKFPEAALGLGEALVRLKQYDEAIQVLDGALNWDKKKRPMFYEGLGRAEAARGKFSEAEVHLLKAREEAPTDPRFHRALGDLYRLRKIPSLAETSYRQAIELDPDDLDSRFAMAHSLRGQARYNEALEQYKEIVQRDSTYALAYREMGELYLLASDRTPAFIGDALANLERARRLDPDDEETPVWLARANYKLRRNEEALALIKPIAERGELDAEGHAIYGRILYENRDWLGAASHLARAGKSLDEIDHRRVASAYINLKQHAKAESVYAALWAADSSSNSVPREKASEWILEQGKVRYSMGRDDTAHYARAITLFQRKIELDPKSDEAYYFMGLSNRELGRPEAAIAALQKSSELAPDKSDRHFWLAATYLTLNRNDEAYAGFERAAALDDSTVLGAIARQRLGFRELLRKDYPAAIRFLERAAEIDAKQVQTWVWLGQAHQNSGQRQKALDAYRKALELDPKQPDARRGLDQLAAR